MKAVSKEYTASMGSLLRNPSLVNILFYQIDTTAATDGEWSSEDVGEYSEFDTLDYTYEYSRTYATLELNRWALNGNSVIVAANGKVLDGYVSDSMSDETGHFESPVSITRIFESSHRFPGLTLSFDTRSSEWPSSVVVSIYSEGNLADTISIPVSETTVIINDKIDDCDKITISFGDGLPYRRQRLQRVLFGVLREISNNDIVSTKQSHDVDPLTRRLPQETMQFTLLDYDHNYDPENPESIYSYLDTKSPVSIQFGYTLPTGQIEWLKPDNYILNSKPSITDDRATFTGTGLIGSLSGMYYKSKVGRKSFYRMAEDVLTDAALTPTAQGSNPWEIDNSLRQMFTDAALPIDTHMNCLQLIAHACRCRLYTDDDNVIHIKPFGVTVVGIYNGIWADNGHLWYSDWNTVDKGNNVTNTYATLELNRWTLDGSGQVVVEDIAPTGRGFVGDAMSSDDGVYTTAPTFTRTFDVAHDLPVLNFRFDTLLGEYPSEITVKYYAGSKLVDTQSVTNITSAEVIVNSSEALDCTKIVVTAKGGLPYRRIRVTKVYYRETDFTLNFDSISENSQSVSKIDLLKSVAVSKYAYTVADDISTLYEGTTSEDTLHVEFSSMAQDVAVSVTGGSLVSSQVYASAVDLVLSSGTKTVKITGKTLTENSVVVTYPVNTEGEIDKEENPLITDDAMCRALAEHVAKYLKMRNTYDAEYRGNPELEVGDIIGLQTRYTDEMDALVLVDEIDFDGALSGKLKVKGLI